MVSCEGYLCLKTKDDSNSRPNGKCHSALTAFYYIPKVDILI